MKNDRVEEEFRKTIRMNCLYANRNWLDNFLHKDEIKRRYFINNCQEI